MWVNEWNQTEPYDASATEATDHFSTGLGIGFGVLHTPEVVPGAKGRMTDRASRKAMTAQDLKL